MTRVRPARRVAGRQGATGAIGAQGPTGRPGAHRPRGPAGAVSVTGAVTFVDRLDTTGFIGTTGSQNVFATAREAASPVAIAGSFTGFSATAGSAVGGGGVTLTLLKNGIATSVACTIASGASSCTDSIDTASFAATNTIAVEIQNGTGTFVRNVSWTGQLG